MESRLHYHSHIHSPKGNDACLLAILTHFHFRFHEYYFNLPTNSTFAVDVHTTVVSNNLVIMALSFRNSSSETIMFTIIYLHCYQRRPISCYFDDPLFNMCLHLTVPRNSFCSSKCKYSSIFIFN